MNLSKYLLTSVLMLSLAGCSLFGGEKDVIEVAPSPTIQNQFALQKVWNNSTSGNTSIYSSLGPVQQDDVIYAASRSGQVKAMDLSTGNTLWNVNLSSSTFFSSKSALLSGGLSADDKYVYVGSERAVVYVLDRTNGALVWQQKVRGEVLARPFVADNKLFIHTSNGYLQSLNRDTGEDDWDVSMEVPTLSLRGSSTPTSAYGAVIVGDDSGHVSAYFTKNGQLIWQQRISQPSGSTEIAKLNDVDTTPVVDGNLVYATGYNGNLVALDLSNGQTVWRRALGAAHSFVIDKDRIFAVDQEDNLLALSKNGGSVIWKQSDFLHRQLTAPVQYQDYLVVGDFEGYLYWINKSDGSVVAKVEVSSSGLASKPIIAGDKVIVQAKNGDIYAYARY